MSLIRGAIERMEGIARHGFPKPPAVLPQIHHAFALLGSEVEVAEDQEELIPFLRDCQKRLITDLKRGELNRVLRGAWCEAEFDNLALAALGRAREEKRSSSARALIDGYLLYFPVEREAIAPLAAACGERARRQDNSWRNRANKFELFDPRQAVERLASRMAAGEPDAFASTCSDAGLGASPFATRIGQLAFTKACLKVAERKREEAVQAQKNLLRLLANEDQFDDAASIVRALLEPWIDGSPEAAHRQAITAFLLDRVADPRLYFKKQKWVPIHLQIAEAVGTERADDIIGVLRRWLTDAAMRMFFRAIAETTDRPDQWKQRQEFWLAYLDADLVTDAWPALGPRAKSQIQSVARVQGERLEHGTTQNGPASSSSLLLQIGDLTISEWSDNGYCRFWSSANPDAPQLYESRYDNGNLRTMHGQNDFTYIGHDAGARWRPRIAKLIHDRTGVPHPQYGRGHR